MLGALVLAAALCAAAAAADRSPGRRPPASPATAGARQPAAAAVVALVVGRRCGRPAAREPSLEFVQAPRRLPDRTDPTARLSNLSGSRYLVWQAAIKAFDAHPGGRHRRGNVRVLVEPARHRRRVPPRCAQHLAAEHGRVGPPRPAADRGACRDRAGRRRGGPAPRATQPQRGRGGGGRGGLPGLPVPRQRRLDVGVHGGDRAGVRRDRDHRYSARARKTAAAAAGPRIVVVAIAVGAGVLQLPGQLSTSAIRRSQAAERAGNGEQALGWAQDAINAEPWSASAYEQRGLVLESAGSSRRAAEDLGQAITREPDNYEHWLILARIETEAGRLDAAVQDYVRARQLRPRASVFTLGAVLPDPLRSTRQGSEARINLRSATRRAAQTRAPRCAA